MGLEHTLAGKWTHLKTRKHQENLRRLNAPLQLLIIYKEKICKLIIWKTWKNERLIVFSRINNRAISFSLVSTIITHIFTHCHTYLRRHRFNRDKPPKTGSSRPTQGHTQNMKLRWYPHVLYYSFSFHFREFLVFFALLGIVEDEFHTRRVSKQKNQRSAMNCQIKKEGGLIPLWHCVKMVAHVFCGL